MHGSIVQLTTVGYLPPAISLSHIALSIVPLAQQDLPKSTAFRLVSINMPVQRFKADGQSRCDLFRTPLHAQQRTGLFTLPRFKGWGIPIVLRMLCRELTGLFGTIAPRTTNSIQPPTAGGLVPVQQLGYLALILYGFHERVNLMSFSLAEVLVTNKQLQPLGQEALIAIHPQPYNHQSSIIKLSA
jgi:hypothetical protein